MKKLVHKGAFDSRAIDSRAKRGLWAPSYFSEALLQSRPLPHIPALPEGDPPSGTSVQSISQQPSLDQHIPVSSSGLLEAANR